MRKKVLVTGGAGFIGSHTADALVRLGCPVVVLDDFSTGCRKNLKPGVKGLRIIEGDVRNPRVVRKAMKDVKVVIHLAAVQSVPVSVARPLLSHSVNATGTLLLLHEAFRQGVERFVYASSSAVYGDAGGFPQREDHALRPSSPYGASKAAGENYCYCYHKNQGLPTVALRYFNVYGPRQNPRSEYAAVIATFIDRIRRGFSPVVEGTGRQSRDFVYVGDVVGANLKAAFGPRYLSGHVFNVASGEDYSVLEVLKYLSAYWGRSPKRKRGPKRKGDSMKTLADVGRARTLLGWRPTTSFQEGLEKTVKWFTSHES